MYQHEQMQVAEELGGGGGVGGDTRHTGTPEEQQAPPSWLKKHPLFFEKQHPSVSLKQHPPRRLKQQPPVLLKQQPGRPSYFCHGSSSRLGKRVMAGCEA